MDLSTGEVNWSLVPEVKTETPVYATVYYNGIYTHEEIDYTGIGPGEVYNKQEQTMFNDLRK